MVSSPTIPVSSLASARASSTPVVPIPSTTGSPAAPPAGPPKWKNLASGSKRDIDVMSARSALDLPLCGGPATTNVPTGSNPFGPELSSEMPMTGWPPTDRRQLVDRDSVGSAPISPTSTAPRARSSAAKALTRRGLPGDVRGPAHDGELGLEAVDDRTPGALRSFSTSFGAPRIEYAPSSDIRSTMRRLTLALTAVGTAPYRSALATAWMPSGRPSPSTRMKML